MQLTEGEMPQFTELLLDISGGLLAYGAEVYRVEESLQYIGAAYGLTEVDVFAIPSHVILTLRLANGSAHTQSKRIFDRATDLDKVDRLGDLCRRICRDRPGCAEIRRELDALRARPTYPPVLAGDKPRDGGLRLCPSFSAARPGTRPAPF